MPPKIRESITELERNGFTNRGGKRSHRNFKHPKCSQPIRILGNAGDDTKSYQIKQVRQALTEVKGKLEKNQTLTKKLFSGATKTIVLSVCVLN